MIQKMDARRRIRVRSRMRAGGALSACAAVFALAAPAAQAEPASASWTLDSWTESQGGGAVGASSAQYRLVVSQGQEVADGAPAAGPPRLGSGWIHTLAGNSAPVATLGDRVIAEDGSEVVDLTQVVLDPDGDALRYELVRAGDVDLPPDTAPTPGWVRLADPSDPSNPSPDPTRATQLRIVPDPDLNDGDNPAAPGEPFDVTLRVDDGRGQATSTIVVTIRVSVTPVPDAPRAPAELFVNNLAAGSRLGLLMAGGGVPAELLGRYENLYYPPLAFSALFLDPDAGAQGCRYRIEVGTGPSEPFISDRFDSASLAEADADGALPMRCAADQERVADIAYRGAALELGTTYYVRLRFWDQDGHEGAPNGGTAAFRLTLGVSADPLEGVPGHSTRFDHGSAWDFAFAVQAGSVHARLFLKSSGFADPARDLVGPAPRLVLRLPGAAPAPLVPTGAAHPIDAAWLEYAADAVAAGDGVARLEVADQGTTGGFNVDGIAVEQR